MALGSSILGKLKMKVSAQHQRAKKTSELSEIECSKVRMSHLIYVSTHKTSPGRLVHVCWLESKRKHTVQRAQMPLLQ